MSGLLSKNKWKTNIFKFKFKFKFTFSVIFRELNNGNIINFIQDKRGAKLFKFQKRKKVNCVPYYILSYRNATKHTILVKNAYKLCFQIAEKNITESYMP